MTDKYDAIVVGAGHNGLVCSALLAKAGQPLRVSLRTVTRCQLVRTSCINCNQKCGRI
jgi:tRNA U34 5-carboxymethylaminomethyl modifying enzyme MnmG/GidA